MSPGRCNTGLTTPRHAEYQTINLGEYYTTRQAMPSEAPVDRWEWVDGLQFVGQAYPTHALLDSSPVSMLANPYDDILRLKAFVYNVCTVRTGVLIHKQKFSTHATLK
ncbi:hypothetical protein TNCV_568941 [Trichonephila clavipes]|nr:hypothetical protein TNCV_568941 [Trichonephila clavipes]